MTVTAGELRTLASRARAAVIDAALAGTITGPVAHRIIEQIDESLLTAARRGGLDNSDVAAAIRGTLIARGITLLVAV